MTSYSAEAIERAVLATLLKHAPSESPKMLEYAHVVDSEYKTEAHEWLSQPARLTEFFGTTNDSPLLGTKYELENKLYDRTLSVHKADWNANKSGSYKMRFQQFARVAANFPNYLLTQALIDGTSDSGYDGVSFFNDAHPARGDEGGTQDNLLAGTGVTASALHTDLGTAIGAMLGFKGENGEPFFADMVPRVGVVCHPNLLIPFSEAIEAGIIAQTSNVNIGIADLYTSNRLSDTNDWYLLGMDDAYKPLIFQELQGLEVTVNRPDSDSYRRDKKIEITADRQCRAGYAFWQSAVKMVNA